jgi:branched-chain amino acid transport system permease protein
MKQLEMNTKNIILGVVLAALLISLPLYVTNSYLLHVIIVGGVWVILTISMHLLLWTGLFTLGHAAFMGIGAYTSALLVMKAGWPFWITFPLAGIVTALVAALAGYVFLKVKGLLFSIVTFAFGEAVVVIFSNWPGPPDGLTAIPIPNAVLLPWGSVMEFIGKVPYYYLVLILTVFTVVILVRIEKSRLGKIFSYINENDALAQSAGINVHMYRVAAFTIACFFAGLAGAFYAHYNTYASPAEFSVSTSVLIFLFCVIGGTRSLIGPVIGALFLTAVPELLRGAKMFQSLIYAIIVLLVVFVVPDGLISIPDRLKLWLNHRKTGLKGENNAVN